MIGIRFKISNDYDYYLDKILGNLDSQNYLWLIKEEEVLNHIGKDFFLKELYEDQEFKNTIKNKHYAIFADIQLINNTNIEEINNYKEFIDSNCNLILFITDNEFVDIYSKNEEFIKTIEKNATDNNFKDIRITYENDHIRNEFSAYTD